MVSVSASVLCCLVLSVAVSVLLSVSVSVLLFVSVHVYVPVHVPVSVRLGLAEVGGEPPSSYVGTKRWLCVYVFACV